MKEELLKEAKKAREYAYVPYSNFPVGAAILTKSGQIYTGCNIENAAYPNTCCAERVAIFKAISSGECEFSAMLVVADSNRPIPPCGSCRQVMSEFFTEDMNIYLANVKGDMKIVSMNELLPFSFQANDMNE